MKPGRRIWSSNNNWAGGPDAGTQTKVKMPDADLAEGRYRSIRPAPQYDNFENWNNTSRLDRAAAMRVLNLKGEPYMSGGWPGVDRSLGCDGVTSEFAVTPVGVIIPRHTIVFLTPAGALSNRISWGGRFWSNDINIVGAGAGNPKLAASDQADIRAVVTATAGGLQPYRSVNGASPWIAWGGGSPALDYRDIDFGGIGGNARWVVGDSLGAILVSQAPGIAFNVPAAPPVFAGPVRCLCHTKHYPGDIYPADPGFDCWTALTATEVSRSIDGQAQTWTGAALHGLGVTPLDVAYSRTNSTFITVCNDGNIARSTDGLNYTLDTGAINSAYAAPAFGRISTDGYGHWTVVFADNASTSHEIHVSWDDGVTWAETFPDAVVGGGAAENCCTWYGNGQFFTLLADDNGGVGFGTLQTSLRSYD